MEISFEDAARGVTAPISITRSDPCPSVPDMVNAPRHGAKRVPNVAAAASAREAWDSLD